MSVSYSKKNPSIVEYQPLVEGDHQMSPGDRNRKCGRGLVVLGGIVVVAAVVVSVMVVTLPHKKDQATDGMHVVQSVQNVEEQGWWRKHPKGEGPCLEGVSEKIIQDEDPDIQERLLQELKADNIRNYLRDLTETPHLAGTPADQRQAEDLKQFWLDAGMDVAKVMPYDVQLSYPDPDNPNSIVLLDTHNKVLYQTQLKEKVVRPEQNQPDVVPPFIAFSPPGTPKGDLVYVNYGRVEDFTWIKENTNIDLSGKIAIARYGKIFRGSKAKLAEEFGAAGLILYSDPADYAVDDVQDVYPDSWWLPGTGVQRGSVNIAGDPLTPGYPAIESAFRAYEKDKLWLPKIPIHPIGYDDAKALMEELRGESVPEGWAGEIPGITYRLGPGHKHHSWKVQMLISTDYKNVTTYNTIAYIRGGIEPDRYVILGNHRDAWVFGAVDPSSGTAVMKEVSRGFGQMLKTGWRPRRTIVFCSWGAEEFGLIGAREWVEHFQHLLGDRAVAYINIDSAVTGNYSFEGEGLPLLEDIMREVAKVVPNPQESEIAKGRATLYDTWAAHVPEKDDNGDSTRKPEIGILGSGSDFEPFVTIVGVSSMDLTHTFDKSAGMSSYPLYHSVYDTFHLMDTFIDPGFKLHLAVAQYAGEMVRHLADTLVLPFNVVTYASHMQQYYNGIVKTYGIQIRQHHNKDLDYLRVAMADFKAAAEDFQDRLDHINKNNPLEVRQYNDQMIQLERAFIDPLGLPGRPYTRHVVFAPSSTNSYAGAAFPGLVDSLFQIDKATGDEANNRWIEVKRQLATLTYFVRVAEASLKSVVDY